MSSVTNALSLLPVHQLSLQGHCKAVEFHPDSLGNTSWMCTIRFGKCMGWIWSVYSAVGGICLGGYMSVLQICAFFP